MRIVFVCPVFPPEPAPAGVMAQELGARLAADGHDVTIVTQFPNRPYGRIFTGYRRSLRSAEEIGGFTLVRCPNWLLDRQRRWWNRVMENVSFGMSSFVNMIRCGRPDIVVLETWPLFATEVVLQLCQHWKTPVLNYVKDCYPEALEYTDHIKKNGRLAYILRGWDRQVCRRSSRVIVISDGMKQLLCKTRGLPDRKVSVIEDWLNARNFPEFQRDNAWRRETGVDNGRFLVLFAGTLGYVSGAEILVEVARRLAHQPKVSLLCVGEGVLKDKMQALAVGAGLQNLVFLPFQPSERVPEMLAAADATILTTQANYPDASVPSKLISYLAAGRPVVCAAHGASTVAQIVRNADAGVLAEPGDAQSVSEAISFLVDHPAEARLMGENARHYFAANLTFESAYGKFSALLKEVANGEQDIEPPRNAGS